MCALQIVGVHEGLTKLKPLRKHPAAWPVGSKPRGWRQAGRRGPQLSHAGCVSLLSNVTS